MRFGRRLVREGSLLSSYVDLVDSELGTFLDERGAATCRVNSYLRGVVAGLELSLGDSGIFELEGDYRFTFDCDSYHYLCMGEVLPLSDSFMYKLYVRPNYDYSVKKNPGFTWHIPGISFNSSTKFKVSDAPNFVLFSFGDCNVSRFLGLLFIFYSSLVYSLLFAFLG